MVLAALLGSASCGDRDRPEPPLEVDPPVLLLLAPPDGITLSRSTLTASGIMTRVQGAKVRRDSQLRISARMHDTAPFFSRDTVLTESQVTVELRIQPEDAAVPGAGTLIVRATLFGPQRSPVAADSAVIAIQ